MLGTKGNVSMHFDTILNIPSYEPSDDGGENGCARAAKDVSI